MNVTNFTIDAGQQVLHKGGSPEVVTTERLLELCGMMDLQALWVAWAGVGVALVMLFWFGKRRAKLISGMDERVVYAIDKFLLTLTAMFFVIIIVRLLRAG